MKQLHMVMAGKGGVGKSYVAYLLGQWFLEKENKLICIDSDPINQTFSKFKGLNVKTLKITDDSKLIDASLFDELISIFNEEPDENTVFVLDTGSGSYLNLINYIIENDVFEVLADNNVKVILHTVVTGGQSHQDTLQGISELCHNFSQEANIYVWQNNHFGKLSKEGQDFEQGQGFKAFEPHLSGLIKITSSDKSADTFGKNLRQLLERFLTFNEGKNDKEGFGLMARSRFHKLWAAQKVQIEQAGL